MSSKRGGGRTDRPLLVDLVGAGGKGGGMIG